jgi:hypothetical protein
MAVRRIPVAALLLGACAAACGQDRLPAAPPPAARLAPVPGPVAVPLSAPDVSPLLAVPPPVAAPRPPCLPCHTDYQPHHVYIPDANPDFGAGSCDGECRPCRQYWVSLALLLGGSSDLGDVHRRLHFGVQGAAGYWFDPTKTFGIEANGLNVHKGYEKVQFDTYVSSPLTVTTADANLRLELMALERYRLDGLVGYRHARLHEGLFINQAGAFAADADTRNQINAGQVGVVGTYRYGAYLAEVLTKVGVGRNSQTITLNGLPQTDSNMSVVPEFGAHVGYQIGEGVYGTLGYTFLYLSNVARPGRSDTDFYLHGFTVGMECRF